MKKKELKVGMIINDCHRDPEFDEEVIEVCYNGFFTKLNSGINAYDYSELKEFEIIKDEFGN